MFIPIEKISNLTEFKKDIFSGKVFVFQKSKTSSELITQIKNKALSIYDGELENPKKNLVYLLNLFICKLNYFYIKFIYRKFNKISFSKK